MTTDFSVVLHHHRKKTYPTQAALADELGVSQMTVSRWERAIDRPSLPNMAKVADALLDNGQKEALSELLYQALTLALSSEETNNNLPPA